MEIREVIKQLESLTSGSLGDIEVRSEMVEVSNAEHTNGWKSGSTNVLITRYFLNGKSVSVVEAARHIVGK